MKAAWYERLGAAREVLQVGEVEHRTPGPGEVQVRIHWSGVNPTDVKRRAGASGPLPFARVIPHMDGSGIIDAVGPGVDSARIGQPVWLHRAAWKRPQGTCAEAVVLPQELAQPLPSGIDLRVGATLGVPALTAHRAVFGFGPVRDRTLLVTGGAGSVGSYAIQLARWGGARVIATVSSELKADHARRSGAQAVINYRQEDVARRVLELTGGLGVDHLVEVDFGTNLAATVLLMKSQGTIAAYASAGEPQPALPVYAMQRKSLSLMFVALFELPPAVQQAAADDVNAWLAAGSFEPPSIHAFDLDEVAAAHEAVEQAAVPGKVLVRVGARVS